MKKSEIVDWIVNDLINEAMDVEQKEDVIQHKSMRMIKAS